MATSNSISPYGNGAAQLLFVPIDASMADQPLKICVAVRGGDTPGSPLILLRNTADARVYLGAQLDAGDTIREWLEIWVQTISGLDKSAAVQTDHLSNQLLDDKWRAAAAHWRDVDGPAFIGTGWEQVPPRPSYLLRGSGMVQHPVDPKTQQPLQLCTADAVLSGAGLPGYAGSLQRYLVSAGANGAGTVLFAATAGAKETLTVRPRSAAVGEGWTPLNPEGGLLMIRRHAPLAYEDYIDLLGGKTWRGIVSGATAVRPGGAYEALGDVDRMLHGGENFFLGGRGRTGLFLETFHLRLRLIYDVVRTVRDVVARRQLPLLNLTTESFRVELAPPGPSLPLLWTARPVLAAPGQAIALPLKTSGVRRFLPLETPATSIFRPEQIGLPTRGEGTVRILKVFTDSAEESAVDATLVTNERLQLTQHDILKIEFPLAAGTIELHGHLEHGDGLAQGERRFRSIPQKLDPDVVRGLRAAEGTTPRCPFETIPMLSTPCDLYALGVLAVRALLVNGKNSLSIALDATLSLARALGQEANGDELGERVRRLAASDPRWAESLGPQRLSHQPMTPAEGFELLPEELWWRAVGTIARLFPGQGPDSYCRDFGDVSNFELEKIFEEPLSHLDNLVINSRGLLLSDWTANREVASVIRRLR